MKSIRELIAEFITDINGQNIEIVEKESSALMHAIGWLFAVTRINPKFLSSYLTTIGSKVFVPKTILDSGDPRRLLDGIIHETVHARDFQKNPVWFIVSYLFPQILAILCIIAILAIVNINFLFFLLFLLMLLPLPAFWRMKWEIRAYRTSLIYARVIYGYDDSNINLIHKWIITQLTTSSYYFTWPFENYLRRELQNEEALKDPIYRQIESFLLKHREEINNSTI